MPVAASAAAISVVVFVDILNRYEMGSLMQPKFALIKNVYKKVCKIQKPFY